MENLSVINQPDYSSELFELKKLRFTIELRRNKRDHEISKKRLRFIQNSQHILEEKTPQKKQRDLSIVINDFLSSFQNKNLAILTKSALEIRDGLARPIMSFNEICDLLMKDGVILILMDIISKEFSEYLKLQESASWTLCNFTSGDTIYVEYALNNDILKNLVEALDFGDGIFLDNCIWALANLIGESKKVRDAIFQLKITNKIYQIISSHQNRIDILRTSIWLLSQLVGDLPDNLLETVFPSLSLITQLCSFEDDIMVEHTLWTFGYFTQDFDIKKTKFCFETGIADYALNLLNHAKNFRNKLLAFRLCSHLLLSDLGFPQVLKEKQYFVCLALNLKDFNSSWCKETCKTLASLVNKYPEVIERANELEIFTQLEEILLGASPEIKVEALNCLSNTFKKCDEEILPEILSEKVFTGVLNALASGLPELILSSVNTIYYILERSEVYCQNLPNPVLEQFKASNGVTIIENLCSHKNKIIAQKACTISDTILNKN